MTESDEREEWTLKICVSVCMSASATTNTLPSISGETRKRSDLPSNYDYQTGSVCAPAAAAPQVWLMDTPQHDSLKVLRWGYLPKGR